MKKQKMLITLAGLVVAVATTATVAAIPWPAMAPVPLRWNPGALRSRRSRMTRYPLT